LIAKGTDSLPPDKISMNGLSMMTQVLPCRCRIGTLSDTSFGIKLIYLLAAFLGMPCVHAEKPHRFFQTQVTTTIKHPNGAIEIRRPDGTITYESGGKGKLFQPDGRESDYYIGRDGEHYRTKTCTNASALGTVVPPYCHYSDWTPAR
jgi:hypothetical protein